MCLNGEKMRALSGTDFSTEIFLTITKSYTITRIYKICFFRKDHVFQIIYTRFLRSFKIFITHFLFNLIFDI